MHRHWQTRGAGSAAGRAQRRPCSGPSQNGKWHLPPPTRSSRPPNPKLPPGPKKKKTALFPRGPVQNSRSGAGMDGDVSENLEGDDARKRGDAGGLEPIQLLGRLFRSLILVFTSQDAAVVGVVAWWPRPAACPRETRRRPCLRAARALNLLVYLLHCSSRHGAWRQEMNCSCRSAVCCRCEHEYGWILSAE